MSEDTLSIETNNKQDKSSLPNDEKNSVICCKEVIDAHDELRLLKSKELFDAISVIDIVGLSSNTNGRSCTAHSCCGDIVFVNSKLLLEWSVQEIKRNTKARIEEVIKAWKIADDGMPCCHVGYVSVSMLSNYNPTSFEGLFLRVKRDLRISDNSHERQRSRFYNGIVECEVIKNNPRYNGHCPFKQDPCDVSAEDRHHNQQLVVRQADSSPKCATIV